MKIPYSTFCAFCLLLFHSILLPEGYLHVNGQLILDGNNDEILLRGMGLGGWMLQEGYMMKTSGFANTQHELKTKIEALVGMENMENFYDTWLNNFCRKVDIDSLASWGFNSIRLPMHYNLFTLSVEDEPVPGNNTWLEKGFALVDSLLGWCEANEIYLILDLHAAPGGQGHDAAISDYDPIKPSLWDSAANRSKMTALWYKIADRYADELWIGGYDLLNETNWELPGNAMLKQLYQDITTLIRTVDTNHIIFIEGNWWANDFTGLTPPWDNNMVYSFHKYWNYNNQESVQWMINMREAYDVPIWCGEAGENSNTWFTDAIALLEDNNIGWAWWPHKKIDTITSPLSIYSTDGYQELLNYWNGNSSQPSIETATHALMEIADQARLENCIYNKDVSDAMFRQITDSKSIPFSPHKIPGSIQAVDFDLGKNGIAYLDNGVANYSVSNGTYTTWNDGFSYRNDGVDIEQTSNNNESTYNIGWIEQNEWCTYSINVVESDSFSIVATISSLNGGGLMRLSANGENLIPSINISNTGGWQNWEKQSIGKIFLPVGNSTIEIKCLSPGYNISNLEFIASSIKPDSFQLFQNYPNPFNGHTNIVYHLPKGDYIQLCLFNILGQTIDILVDDYLPAGNHSYRLNGNAYGSGIYFYRLQTDSYSSIGKMILVK